MDAATARFSELARECGRLEVRVETLEEALGDLVSLAEDAMRHANRYGAGEYRVDAELADARAALDRAKSYDV